MVYQNCEKDSMAFLASNDDKTNTPLWHGRVAAYDWSNIDKVENTH
jgi:hypothetical protein